MKIIYKSYMARPLKPFGEWNWEVREVLLSADNGVQLAVPSFAGVALA